MARYYFKDQSPIGRRLSWKLFNGNWSPKAEIVGVAADTRADGIEQTPFHTMYQPDAQTSAQSTLLVRTAGSTDHIAPRVVETIRSLDPNRPIDHVQTLEEIRDETIAPQRLNATLIGLFALLALAIATVGVAGVLAFSVSQRTNELGIRLALGAERQTILRMILGEGAAMALDRPGDRRPRRHSAVADADRPAVRRRAGRSDRRSACRRCCSSPSRSSRRGFRRGRRWRSIR